MLVGASIEVLRALYSQVGVMQLEQHMGAVGADKRYLSEVDKTCNDIRNLIRDRILALASERKGK